MSDTVFFYRSSGARAEKWKSPTAVQASRLWDSAAQRAHDESLDVHRGSGSGESVIDSGERKSKRHKRTRVEGIGFLDLNY